MNKTFLHLLNKVYGKEPNKWNVYKKNRYKFLVNKITKSHESRDGTLLPTAAAAHAGGRSQDSHFQGGYNHR